ncbi:unnamed protein product [Amoebophrya sp. A120]|nr:unnamed protein product [Amoebophrya sp. A120]|eukprot:GSA120T00015105001.1
MKQEALYGSLLSGSNDLQVEHAANSSSFMIYMQLHRRRGAKTRITSFWPIKCMDPAETEVKDMKTAEMEKATEECPVTGREPDNPTKYEVDLYAKREVEKAEDELHGLREKSRHFAGDNRLQRIETAAKQARENAMAKNAGEKKFRESDFTVEKFVRGIPPWLQSKPGMMKKDETTPMPDHCKNKMRLYDAESKVTSRQSLNDADPVDLELRMTDMATHAYYMWGQAKYLLSLVAMHSPQAKMARNLENVAHDAYESSIRVIKAAGIPRMKTSPYLPLYETGVKKAGFLDTANPTIAEAVLQLATCRRGTTEKIDGTGDEDERSRRMNQSKTALSVFISTQYHSSSPQEALHGKLQEERGLSLSGFEVGVFF